MTKQPSLDRLLKARAEIDEELRRYRTTLTVLFSDVVGSTRYFERFGDTAGVTMLRRQTELLTEVIQESEGRVIKTIGDSVMAEFAEPAKAVRAAVEIQRKLLHLNESLPEDDRMQIRIGMHHGFALRHEGDVFGDAVNVAARITKRSGPAQVLISRSVHGGLEGSAEFRCKWLGKFPIEGRTEREDLFEVVWTDSGTYAGVRQHVTEAMARGELMEGTGKLDAFIPSVPLTTPLGQSTPSISAPVPPELEARYVILAEAGLGGMGVVYKARDIETGELVALKILKPEIASDQAVLERFKDELRLARKISHRNICRIHEFNRINGTAYITMEFVEGESLRHVLNRFGGLSVRQGLNIVRQICAGLREAHAQGVVHRDLKPENVMLSDTANVKIMDFGIAIPAGARDARPSVVLGTPEFMAPEQAEAAAVDHRADIYALGLLMYEIFTGSMAFRGDTPAATAIKQIRERPRPPRAIDPSLPADLERVILRCLEKSPANRYATVEQLEAALAAMKLAAAAEMPRGRLVMGIAACMAATLMVGGVIGNQLAPPASVAESNVAASTNASPLKLTVPPAAPPEKRATASKASEDAKSPSQVARARVKTFPFELRESRAFVSVGPTAMRLHKADVRRQTYTLSVRLGGRTVELKDRALGEPVQFHLESRRHEVLVEKIDDGRAAGRIRVPEAVARPVVSASQ